MTKTPLRELMIPSNNINSQAGYPVYEEGQRTGITQPHNQNELNYRTMPTAATMTHPHAYPSFYQTQPQTVQSYLYFQNLAQPVSSVGPEIQARNATVATNPPPSLMNPMGYDPSLVSQQSNYGYVHISDEELSRHHRTVSPPPNENRGASSSLSPSSSSSPPTTTSSRNHQGQRSSPYMAKESGLVKKRPRGNYNCSKCGSQKKGHQCTTVQMNESEIQKLHDTIQQLQRRVAQLEQELAEERERHHPLQPHPHQQQNPHQTTKRRKQ
eukprot:TRINITY_DN836_c1_g2_i1.p1 TRINITY_DN836_c1_g2~~TRINITY_DN836_c1_g2_i1.p1  ORF type:complete len:269 (+),score=43.71 TRINITY_DN836_c1_g2_i1:260-1066(+)